MLELLEFVPRCVRKLIGDHKSIDQKSLDFANVTGLNHEVGGSSCDPGTTTDATDDKFVWIDTVDCGKIINVEHSIDKVLLAGRAFNFWTIPEVDIEGDRIELDGHHLQHRLKVSGLIDQGRSRMCPNEARTIVILQALGPIHENFDRGLIQ